MSFMLSVANKPFKLSVYMLSFAKVSLALLTSCHLPGNTKGGKFHCIVDLLFDWFGFVVLQIKTKMVSCHTANSKPVKQEVNGTVILRP